MGDLTFRATLSVTVLNIINGENLNTIPTLVAMTSPKAAPDLEKIEKIITEFCSDIERFSDDEISSVVRSLYQRIPINKLSNASR